MVLILTMILSNDDYGKVVLTLAHTNTFTTIERTKKFKKVKTERSKIKPKQKPRRTKERKT